MVTERISRRVKEAVAEPIKTVMGVAILALLVAIAALGLALTRGQ